MTRASNFAVTAVVVTVIYLLLLLQIVPVPFIPASVTAEILPTLPWWVLVSTGAYLLSQVGWGLFNFNDTPQAYNELLLDIKEAKDFLHERGVTVD